MASLVVSGDTSGAITIAAPAIAGTNTLTLPASTGTLVVTGGAQTIEFAAGTVSAPSITFTGDTNTGIFSPAADTIAFTEGGAEAMRITSAGAVLIGTTSTATSSTLNIDSAGYQPLYVNTTISGGGGAAFSRSGTQALYTGTAGSSWLTGSSTADGLIRSEANMLFATGNTERMRITSGGNLLIGGTSLTPFSGTSGLGVTRATNPAIYISQTQSTGGYTAKDYVNYISQEGALAWYDTTAQAERMRITSGGDVLVAKTNSSISTVGSTQFATGQIDSTMTSSTSSASTYNVYSTGAGAYRFYVELGGQVYATSTTINAISDQRLKENVRDLDTGINTIMSVKPRRFDWKEGKGQDKKNAVGFIAQEFETVFPNSVNLSKAGEDGIEYKTVCHEELIPALVKAIQEQQQIINDLKARIETLENT
jgi:hypothetical protein